MPVRRGTSAFLLALSALCWSAFLVSSAFWAPLYEGQTATSGGMVTRTSVTLVGVNGPRAALLLGVPLLLTLAAAIALHFRCASGSRTGTGAARLAICLLVVLTLLGAASIGMYVVPGVLLLVAAARLTPAG
jgi:hypothetical protein